MRNTLLSLTGLLATSVAAHAFISPTSLTLVDNFEDGDAVGWLINNDQDASGPTPAGVFEVVDDPVAPLSNKAARFNQVAVAITDENGGQKFNNLTVSFDLPTPLPEGGVLYFRSMAESSKVNAGVGLSDVISPWPSYSNWARARVSLALCC